ncbi:MAG: hypothetical protein MMC33_004860 [Icmadophila ericetorum]|nr:hypothetical protein [Icmadophila ericetorum]
MPPYSTGAAYLRRIEKKAKARRARRNAPRHLVFYHGRVTKSVKEAEDLADCLRRKGDRVFHYFNHYFFHCRHCQHKHGNSDSDSDSDSDYFPPSRETSTQTPSDSRYDTGPSTRNSSPEINMGGEDLSSNSASPHPTPTFAGDNSDAVIDLTGDTDDEDDPAPVIAPAVASVANSTDFANQDANEEYEQAEEDEIEEEELDFTYLDQTTLTTMPVTRNSYDRTVWRSPPPPYTPFPASLQRRAPLPTGPIYHDTALNQLPHTQIPRYLAYATNRLEAPPTQRQFPPTFGNMAPRSSLPRQTYFQHPERRLQRGPRYYEQQPEEEEDEDEDGEEDEEEDEEEEDSGEALERLLAADEEP